jgi:phytoene dehydrogenase-like protein
MNKTRMNKTRMNKPLDTIIIGAGHNGLVTAAYLAKAGQSVLVAESRDVLGGAAATEEVFAGYKVDTGAHRIGGLNQKVVSDLGLTGHGLEILQADPSVFTPVEAGRPCVTPAFRQLKVLLLTLIGDKWD